MPELATNLLYYGDNLDVLRRYLPDAAVDLVYLDPPFNSNRDDDVIFRDESGKATDAQLLAFEDTWHIDRKETLMAGPFIFISKHRIKEGKLEDYKLYVKKLVEMVEAKEPRMIAFEVYTNEEATEGSGIQVHPDADSMEFHMQTLSADNTIGAAFEFLEPTYSIEVCGTPNDRVLEMMRQLAGSGVALSVKPQHLGGFIRTPGN